MSKYKRSSYLQRDAKAYSRDAIVRVLSTLRVGRLLSSFPIARQTNNPAMGVNTSISSSVATARKVAVFAHYSAMVEISPSDAYLIACLRDAGFSVIVSSTCTDDPAEHERLWSHWSGKIDGLLTRPNFGFDFASWSAVILNLPLQEMDIEQLVLVNNSVFGPVIPLDPILEDLFSRGDLFGLTASQEFSPHLQSYFLGFNRTVLLDPCFKQFWGTTISGRSKWSTIIHRELTWERFFVQSGFSAVAFVEETRTFPRNPLTFLWRDLLIQGFPFIKKSLFTHNYDEIDMTGWQEFLATECPYFDSSLIINDL